MNAFIIQSLALVAATPLKATVRVTHLSLASLATSGGFRSFCEREQNLCHGGGEFS